MQDFSRFILKCAVSEEWADTAVTMLRGVAMSQHAEAESNNPIIAAIQMYIGLSTNHSERVHAQVLAKRLSESAEKVNIHLKFEVGEYGTGGILLEQFSALEKRFGLSRKQTGRTHPYKWWFAPSPEVLEECREYAKQADRMHF